MISRLIAITLAASWAAGASAQTRDPIYVIRRIHLITMTDTAADGVKDVVIRGRRIDQIHAAATAKVAGATVIDGSGKYLIPGLIDSHVHIKEEDPLFLFVAAGVTTVQNMAGRPFHLDMRTATNQGTRLGPRIVTTGPTTAQVGVNTLEEVERLVREQHRLGDNAIKMYGSGRDGGIVHLLG